MAHHLPVVAIDGDDNSRAVEGHLLHLVPVLADILRVAHAPAVIEEFLSARCLGLNGSLQEGEPERAPWQQSRNTTHSHVQGNCLRAYAGRPDRHRVSSRQITKISQLGW